MSTWIGSVAHFTERDKARLSERFELRPTEDPRVIEVWGDESEPLPWPLEGFFAANWDNWRTVQEDHGGERWDIHKNVHVSVEWAEGERLEYDLGPTDGLGFPKKPKLLSVELL